MKAQFMLTPESKFESFLHIRAVTWLKDSHSLFDYEFNSNVNQEAFDIALSNKFIFLYRNNITSQILIRERQKMTPSLVSKQLQLLGCFELTFDYRRSAHLEFHHASEFKEALKGLQDLTSFEDQIQSPLVTQPKNQDIYLIVRSLKNKNNENKGYRLRSGQFVKLGRVQYRVSRLQDRSIMNPQRQPGLNQSVKQWYKIPGHEEHCCKYCLDGQVDEVNNFLMSPCKCSGSTGLVHFKCLEQWIQSKVKRQISGGTVQYNFQKFFCQLCKDQFPKFIKKQDNFFQLMQIQKPEVPHVVLQGVSEKSKNMIVVQDVPQDGIKLGRSHECEIRITDVSVSRSHTYIQKVNGDFYIFDNKSKFGTLVKENNIKLELSRIKQGVQIGRTVFTFELMRKQK